MELTKEKLENLYMSKRNVEICKILGISNPTLVSYLRKFGIKQKGRGNKLGHTKIKLSGK